MIVGDEGSGKTNFLRMISSSISRLYSRKEVSYVILSDNTTDWKNIELTNNCEDILSIREPRVVNYLNSMAAWTHANKGSQQIHLLLIDHLESLLTVPEIQQDLRWLLLRGPSRHIWPIVTINSSIAVSELFRPWLGSFRTRLFGYMKDDRKAEILSGLSKISLSHLTAGDQYAMREGNDWLSFWIPTLD